MQKYCREQKFMRNEREGLLSNWTAGGHESCDGQVGIMSPNPKQRHSIVIHIVIIWQRTKGFLPLAGEDLGRDTPSPSDLSSVLLSSVQRSTRLTNSQTLNVMLEHLDLPSQHTLSRDDNESPSGDADQQSPATPRHVKITWPVATFCTGLSNRAEGKVWRDGQGSWAENMLQYSSASIPPPLLQLQPR